jgi:hypothetical protein
MPDLVVGGLDAIDKFVKLGNELAKLPAFVFPQYRTAAIDLYQICQKLLVANENLARWLYSFQYFDFTRPSSVPDFLGLCQKYTVMKTGPERRELKFRCSDIRLIYKKEIESKIGTWFTNQQRAKVAGDVFEELTGYDQAMVDFIEREVINRLDTFEKEVEPLVRGNDLNGAEAARLRFKALTGDLGRRLEQFSGELSDLVIKFAEIGKIPVTLAQPGP